MKDITLYSRSLFRTKNWVEFKDADNNKFYYLKIIWFWQYWLAKYWQTSLISYCWVQHNSCVTTTIKQRYRALDRFTLSDHHIELYTVFRRAKSKPEPCPAERPHEGTTYGSNINIFVLDVFKIPFSNASYAFLNTFTWSNWPLFYTSLRPSIFFFQFFFFSV